MDLIPYGVDKAQVQLLMELGAHVIWFRVDYPNQSAPKVGICRIEMRLRQK